jgi:Spx/MgsR family transcriptional regulator
MIKIYGIPHCDTVKKALGWLNKHDIPFEFHDYKKEGISATKLKAWCKIKGWENIFNKRSSTWKEVMGAHEGIVNNQAEALHIMQHHTSIIKRPVIEFNNGIIIGFDEGLYTDQFLKTQKEDGQ